MQISQNRQSGFIKKCKSSKNIYQEVDYLRKEQFSRLDEEFSSFHYRYPYDESQEQFSMFVLNKREKVGNAWRDGLEEVKENDYKIMNRMEDIKCSNRNSYGMILKGEYKNGSFGQKHKKSTNINNTKQQQQMAEKFYSPSQYTDLRTNPTRKQVGKLRKNSRDLLTFSTNLQTHQPSSPTQYFQQQHLYKQSSNQKQIYPGLHSQRHYPNMLQRAKSQKHIYPTNNYEPKYQKDNFIKHKPSNPTQYKRDSHNYNNFKQNLTHKMRKPCNQVSQSSVMESQPSFLKDRIQEVERKKRELQNQKRQLEEIKMKNFEVLKRQNNRNEIQSLESESNIEELSSQQQQSSPQQVNQSSSSSSDSSFDRNQESNQVSSRQKASYSSSSSHNLQPNMLTKELIHRERNAQQKFVIPEPNTNLPKSPKNNQFTSKIINLKIKSNKNNNKTQNPETFLTQHHFNTNSVEIKASPLQIIKEIQKRAQRLQQCQLKEMYEKQGIAVTKGGLTFEIDTKQFVFPKDQNQKNSQNQNQSNLKPFSIRQALNSNYKKSGKNSKKINSKEELKRRRQLAKSYDRYARNKLFGSF